MTRPAYNRINSRFIDGLTGTSDRFIACFMNKVYILLQNHIVFKTIIDCSLGFIDLVATLKFETAVNDVAIEL